MEDSEVLLTAGTATSDLVVPGASAAAAVGLTQTDDGSPTIPVANVLESVIEGWLLGDLESMATEITPKKMGAVGYPMVMSVLSGSELLGALTSDVSQTNRIPAYWENFLVRIDLRYGHLGDIASELARNGIAHSYLSHLGVVVTRGAGDRHLSLEGDEVVFDCLELHAHFRRSYEEYARSYILDHVGDAQRRVDALLRYDQLKARSKIANLPAERFPQLLAPIPAAMTTATTAASGTRFVAPLDILGRRGDAETA